MVTYEFHGNLPTIGTGWTARVSDEKDIEGLAMHNP